MAVRVWKLGVTSFDTAYNIQKALSRKHLDAMLKRQDTNYDTILLTEHSPVYTVGIRDQTSMAEVKRLKMLGAEFRRTTRGGLMTFHGPGQLVAYPIINLKHFKTSVKWYVSNLEETVIQLCQELGLDAVRSEHTGVWIEDSKLAAIGIHARRYVTTHGISLNCDNDLEWFKHIDPCGLSDKGVTSLSKETGQAYTVSKIEPLFLKSFQKVFNCECKDIEQSLQKEVLTEIYNKLLTDAQEKAARETASDESMLPWQATSTFS